MKVKKAHLSEWHDFVENCSSATFFHSISWYEIWQTYKGYAYQPFLIEFTSGSKVLVPLASYKILRGYLKRHISSPAGTYGGFLSPNKLKDFEIQQLAHWIKGFGGINITLTPFHESAWNISGASLDFTQIISLDQPWPRIKTEMKKGHILRKVRLAERNQLEFRKISREEVPSFHGVYLSRRGDWEKPSNNYSLALFELIYDKLHTDFWGVFHPDQTLIGGGIFLRQKGHVSSWLPVMLTAHLSLKPYEFLFFHCIRYYHAQGLRWFDFNPSGGHVGVVRFKAGFGAVQRQVINWEHTNKIIRTADKLHQLKSRFR